ncbi:hypothetical protein C8Q80DRAFT_1194543 [Daedaleopsis nitida]|nr:hypothetical protein C8Q80DRAFT_1194543 [Daedaleopsis nitida]
MEFPLRRASAVSRSQVVAQLVCLAMRSRTFSPRILCGTPSADIFPSHGAQTTCRSLALKRSNKRRYPERSTLMPQTICALTVATPSRFPADSPPFLSRTVVRQELSFTTSCRLSISDRRSDGQPRSRDRSTHGIYEGEQVPGRTCTIFDDLSPPL